MITSNTNPVRGELSVARPPGADRIGSIDFTKGMLVVFMVVYHALNYSNWRMVPGQYLGFLPPSFILITGFLLTNVYTGKYQAGNWALYRRLLIRGVKLVLIFTVLNVVGNAVVAQNYNGQRLSLAGFFQDWQAVFIWGNERKASFGILLPIGYLLVVAPLLLRAHFKNHYIMPCLALALLVVCSVMEQAGIAWSHLSMLNVGVIGAVAGTIPLVRMEAVLLQRWPMVVAAYMVYWVCRIVWGQIYPVQVFAACITVPLIHTVAVRLGATARWIHEVCRLGRYSLFSYIAQIAILQIFYRVRLFDVSPLIELAFLGIGTLAATWVAVCLVEFFRRRSKLVEHGYRVAFG